MSFLRKIVLYYERFYKETGFVSQVEELMYETGWYFACVADKIVVNCR